MCGIAGIWNFNREPVDPSHIARLVDAQTHRGPDDRGVWFNNGDGIALGHRRLSILDLSASGRQPMEYARGRFQIAFNGEIYNYLEIKDELEKKGCAFRTRTDTEVLLAAYSEWGEEALHKLNGMWAFAIYDAKEKRLFLSRDRFGIKPLYYYYSPHVFAFASEVKALHYFLGSSQPLNDAVIRDIAKGSFANHCSTQTYLKDVYGLPGGFNATVKNTGSVTTQEWYRLQRTVVPVSFKEQAEALKELLIDACAKRLRSDVPVATCLSGGLDSGSITAVIKLLSDSNKAGATYSHRAFCAAFPGTPIDESDSAKKLADHFGSAIDVVPIAPPSPDELKTAMRGCDGPMHALAFYPIWVLYRYIKEHGITVTLDGQGPDEMLGGYRPVTEALISAIRMRNPFWFFDVYRTYGLQGETNQSSSKMFARTSLFKVLTLAMQKTILHSARGNSAHKEIQNNLPPAKIKPFDMNTLDTSLYTQFFQNPLPGILNQYDRCSMAHGVECRMPFMDSRIVELVFSLPVQSKVGKGYTKRVLREAMRGVLPDSTRLNRLKIGFNAPIVDWFRGSLKEFMNSYINSKAFAECEYFNGPDLKDRFIQFQKDPSPQWDTAWQFWPPVHLMWWKENLKPDR